MKGGTRGHEGRTQMWESLMIIIHLGAGSHLWSIIQICETDSCKKARTLKKMMKNHLDVRKKKKQRLR